ncbi:MAG: DUF4191 domain-containing protein [Bifidobacteriaceae bacterium]|nr:DUF4191 domain-containing protein [Bifidobacteriaceae bacterium]
MASNSPRNDPWAEPELTGRAGKKASKAAARQAKKAARSKKERWYKQMASVYKLVAKEQPLIWLWLVLIFCGIEGAGLLIGGFIWQGRLGYMAFLSAPIGALAATMFLARRAEATAYGRIEGQAGAAASALGTIRRGWTIGDEPVAVDPRSMDMVFRAVGRPGIVLIGDGNPNKLRGMLKKEHQRVARVAPGVPVTELTVGRGEGQVPLRKLVRKMRRLKPVLNKTALAEVNRRLQSIGGIRLPVPKGIDPLKARPDRKALRGR